jgi:hypothetical protein
MMGPAKDMYLVREMDGVHEPVEEDYKLVVTIEARIWFQCFLNYEWPDRDRMILELEGGTRREVK